MVSLRFLVTGAAVLMAGPVMAALSPDQIAAGLAQLTARFKALQPAAQSINPVNTQLVALGQGPYPQIIKGLHNIVSTATPLLNEQQGTTPIAAGADADRVYNAYHEFASVQVALYDLLTKKATIIVLAGPPLYDILRTVEAVVDAIATTLVKNVPTKRNDVETQAASVNKSLTACKNKYSGIV